jgi:tetratricopeptide (TPR) repeat protein
MKHALATADRALAIDPDQPLALAARGRASLLLWDWATADAATRRAVEVAPTNSRTTLKLAFYLFMLGRFEEGFPVFEANHARNSMAPAARMGLGWSYYFGRRYQRAIDHLTPLVTAATLKSPGIQAAVWLVQSHAEMARFADAIALADRVQAATTSTYVLAQLVPALVMAGETERAREIVARLTEQDTAYNRAVALDAIGDVDAALGLIEQLVDRHNFFAVLLKITRFSPGLRSHARFQAVLTRVGFPG